MFEIHVTISCPDLLAAAQLLVKKTAEPQAAPVPTPAPVATQQAAPQPASVSQPAPAPVAPAVPLAAAPTYTMAQIANAGAELIRQNPGLLPQVNALLTQYGVQAVTDVKPEHYGAFATALRGMGAKI